MSDLGDLLEFLIGIVGIVCAACLGIAIVCAIYIATFSRMACNDVPGQYGIESRFNFWNGCAVKTDQGWIPRDKWESRDIQDRHEVTIRNKP
jgi:hypothetical protein